MQTPVEQFMHREFRALPETATDEDALNLMRRNFIHQIPALDDAGRVVRLFRLEELIKPKERSNIVVIMAEGGASKISHDQLSQAYARGGG